MIPGSRIAAGLPDSGSIGHSDPMLPPCSLHPLPFPIGGGGDGATAASALAGPDASESPTGGTGTLPAAGSPIPFDLLLRGWR